MARSFTFYTNISNSTCPSWRSIITEDFMKYRVVQFPNGLYALEKMEMRGILWWRKLKPTGYYKDLHSKCHHWERYESWFKDCLSNDKYKLLDLADVYNKNDEGVKVITRNPLEELL